MNEREIIEEIHRLEAKLYYLHAEMAEVRQALEEACLTLRTERGEIE